MDLAKGCQAYPGLQRLIKPFLLYLNMLGYTCVYFLPAVGPGPWGKVELH